MTNPIRLALVLHNHQPVGNFDHVLEQAYQDSYLPFLDVFRRFESLKISLHTSGSLMQWLDAHHGEYVDRLAELVAAGRIEIIGGAYYEPILSMIPSRDRIGQIRGYSRWLEDRLGATVRGMWIPERVWEQSFTSDLATAGIRYTVLDDFHFKNAGLAESELHGGYLTEDDGHLLTIYPGSEPLRYAIPFADPQKTIDHLAGVAEQHPGAVVVFGDDGEKFGTWPETKKHVYTDGWLERFFDALVANGDWLKVTTLAEATEEVPPVGKIFLPDGSYREMTEWVLPPERLAEYERMRHDMEHDPRWETLQQFTRGGFWRNFRVRYTEANEMYARMMMVSRRLAAAVEAGALGELVDEARAELYRGQCNCSYWHGAFGGIYLPHLRNAVYRHLISAERLLDRIGGRPQRWIEATVDDYNFDGRPEVHLANDKLAALITSGGGGHLYELDVRSICHNLLATLQRRPEAYHRKVLAGNQGSNGDVSSIHDRVVFKQKDLDQRIQYDDHPRKSLLDHFFSPDATLESVVSGAAAEEGDFLDGIYETRVRRNPDRIQVQLIRQGSAGDAPVRITKGVTLDAGSSTLEIAYQLDNLPTDHPLHFGVEFNFAGLPSGANDRFFYDLHRKGLGQLGTQQDLRDAQVLGLVDEWLGIDVALKMSRPGGIWAFPIETVSQSEGGFELVHQSVAVIPHWLVEPDENGSWTVTMHLAIDTKAAENHLHDKAIVATG